jgi:hypothetical protein
VTLWRSTADENFGISWIESDRLRALESSINAPFGGEHIISDMTSDERAQLVEDIKKSDNYRRRIVESAELSPDFDIVAAWEDVEELERSISERIVKARSTS